MWFSVGNVIQLLLMGHCRGTGIYLAKFDTETGYIVTV